MVYNVRGWSDLVEWFGSEPSFHDAEVVTLCFSRDPEPSYLLVDLKKLSNKIDDHSKVFLVEKQCLVKISLYNIIYINISDWNHQNVIEKILIDHYYECLELKIISSFGLDLVVKCSKIEISFCTNIL